MTRGTGKTPCKYGPVFASYLHDWTVYGINKVQKWLHIYMAFFLWGLCPCLSLLLCVSAARLIVDLSLPCRGSQCISRAGSSSQSPTANYKCLIPSATSTIGDIARGHRQDYRSFDGDKWGYSPYLSEMGIKDLPMGVYRSIQTVTKSRGPTRRDYHYNKGAFGISGVNNKVAKKDHRHKWH